MDFNQLKGPYFIAEIGINHNGDIEIAKKLIDAAFACEWNCVKFQKRTPDTAVSEDMKNLMRQTPWGRITYLEYRHKIEFSKEEYDYIDTYCKEKPIDWTASVWDVPSLEFISNYDVPFIKIPSALLTDDELLEQACLKGKPLMLSTGMSTWPEIDHAVELVLKRGITPVIMHTNSSYPTPLDELNLNLIPELKKRYNCPVGYSGHEDKLEPTVVAVVLGAEIIERHVTLSHDMWGTDQRASLEVMGMDMLRKRSKDIEVMLGAAEKKITKSEIPIREKLRKKEH